MKEDWFKSWFNTAYYHILYKDRNNKEAANFIDALVDFLKVDTHAHILDLACGKGRHSVYLNKLGYQVTGVDLSKESINFAKQFECETLHFFTHDMRNEIKNISFSHVFNLFTSFGYFDNELENIKVLHSIEKMLIPEGVVVIDFMNSVKVLKNLIAEEKISKGGIDFHITKKYEGNHIYKHIQFSDNGETFNYTEKVQALTKENFIKLFNATKLQIIHTFGDSKLNEFDEKNSDRLILIAKKSK